MTRGGGECHLQAETPGEGWRRRTTTVHGTLWSCCVRCSQDKGLLALVHNTAKRDVSGPKHPSLSNKIKQSRPAFKQNKAPPRAQGRTQARLDAGQAGHLPSALTITHERKRPNLQSPGASMGSRRSHAHPGTGVHSQWGHADVVPFMLGRNSRPQSHF